MNIYFGAETLQSPPWEASAATIGVFDGVHLGHQRLVQETVQQARAEGLPAIVCTFDVHPAEVLRPDKAPLYLCSLHHRLERFAALGADQSLVLRFDSTLASLSARQFVEAILVGKLRVRYLVIGYDFRFGHGREGDTKFLSEVGTVLGFQMQVVSPITDPSGMRVSSTHIRHLVQAGEVEKAGRLLGEPLTWTGTVIRGTQRGVQLGFPTANLKPVTRLVTPADGVYAARARLQGVWYAGAVSVGAKPTFPDAPPSVEVYLLDFPPQPLYGRTLDLQFITRLRNQQRFETPDALSAQIAKDVEKVREVMRMGEWEGG